MYRVLLEGLTIRRLEPLLWRHSIFRQLDTFLQLGARGTVGGEVPVVYLILSFNGPSFSRLGTYIGKIG